MVSHMDQGDTRRKKTRLLLLVLVGCACLVVLVLGFALLTSSSGLLRARAAANEASAITSLRAVLSAQATFAASCGHAYYARSLTTLGRRPKDGGEAFLPPELAGVDRVRRSQYEIWIEAPTTTEVAQACNGAGPNELTRRYVVRAEPVDGGGTRYFAMTERGDIYQSSRPVRFGADGRAEPPAAPLF